MEGIFVKKKTLLCMLRRDYMEEIHYHPLNLSSKVISL